jgi:hypothetical protein
MKNLVLLAAVLSTFALQAGAAKRPERWTPEGAKADEFGCRSTPLRPRAGAASAWLATAASLHRGDAGGHHRYFGPPPPEGLEDRQRRHHLTPIFDEQGSFDRLPGA